MFHILCIHLKATADKLSGIEHETWSQANVKLTFQMLMLKKQNKKTLEQTRNDERVSILNSHPLNPMKTDNSLYFPLKPLN